MTDLDVQVADRVATVTIDRPAVNALSRGLLAEIAATFDAFADDRAVDAAVLRAAGERAFVGGAVLDPETARRVHRLRPRRPPPGRGTRRRGRALLRRRRPQEDPPGGPHPEGGITRRLATDPIDAARAERVGLVNRVVPAGTALAATPAMADVIASRAPLGVRRAKEATVRALNMPLDDGPRMERLTANLLAGTADLAEGRAAFLAKRTPRFEGR